MSHALIDKRCTENCAKAQLTVDISRTVEAVILYEEQKRDD